MLFDKITERKTCESFTARIYIAGPIEIAKQILRREALLDETYQQSYTAVTPAKSIFVSNR